MMIIAVFFTPEIHFEWLGLVVLAMVFCEALRRFGVKSFWPYFLIGAPLSWFGLHNTGVHAALALVPVIPFMPHAERDAGLFAGTHSHDANETAHLHDTMNEFEHFFKPIVDVGLLFFGLANAGVLLSGEALTSSPTIVIFLALLVGKTVGIFVFSWGGTLLGLQLPKHMNLKQCVVLGCVAGIGFTVALFVTTVAIQTGAVPKGDIGDQLKLGALLSFSAGPIAFVLSKLFAVKRITDPSQL